MQPRGMQPGRLRCLLPQMSHAPCAANYLEVADIDTVTTAAGANTANSFTDGLTLTDGTFVPLNQARLPVKPNPRTRF